jgi:nitrogenase molybdenum-iron protein NifN
VEAFGLQPVMVPDLAHSMDGHLARGDYLPVSQGGTDVLAVRQLGQSAATLVIGPSLSRAGQLLQKRTGVESHGFAHLMTLAEMDRFILTLQRLAERPVPEWIERSRGQLQDAMIDTHTWVNGRRIAIGAEADLLAAWLGFAQSVGLQPCSVVAPVNQPWLAGLPVESVRIGDLQDLVDGIEGSLMGITAHKPVDLLLSNSHGADLAVELDVPLLRIGFPIYDRMGEFRRTRQGYAGMRDTLFEIGNLMQERCHGRAVHHSPLKQQFAAVDATGEQAYV